MLKRKLSSISALRSARKGFGTSCRSASKCRQNLTKKPPARRQSQRGTNPMKKRSTLSRMNSSCATSNPDSAGASPSSRRTASQTLSDRYQESEERLSVENARLEQELHDQKADFTDIREYLQHQVTHTTKRIEELEKCKTRLEEELEQTKIASKVRYLPPPVKCDALCCSPLKRGCKKRMPV